MLVRRIVFTAIFALVTASMATFGAPTLAQSQDSDQKATVKQDKQAKQGWEKADNGSYVNPADDPRYPGASPSAGTVQTKDDMDSDGFKPKALIEGAQDDDADDIGTVVVTRQEVLPTPVPQDQTDTTSTDVDADLRTDVDTIDTTTDVDTSTQTDVDTTTTTAERDAMVNRTPTAPAATSTRRHTRLE
jgi:hypothetical protein